jgi:hypothetical protein
LLRHFNNRRETGSTGFVSFLKIDQQQFYLKMAGIGATILVAVVAVFVIKFLFSYFKNLRFNSSVHSPGIPYPVSTKRTSKQSQNGSELMCFIYIRCFFDKNKTH